MSGWVETYRGNVNAWECDTFAHLTIAYYAERFEDAATAACTHWLGVAGTTLSLYIRHLRELRAGDLLRVESAVIAQEGGRVTIGHRLIDIGRDLLAATAEQRLLCSMHALPLQPWDGPARATHAAPAGDDGFVPSGRSIVKSWEVGSDGRLGWQHLVHRLSGACLHACAAFGMTPDYLRDNRRGFSTFELDLAITTLPDVGAALLVRSGILQIGNSSIRLLHRMYDATTGEPVAAMSQYGVHFDMEARRGTPLPEPLHEAALKLVPASA
jgi:acyl-CoA thioesterase FadM